MKYDFVDISKIVITMRKFECNSTGALSLNDCYKSFSTNGNDEQSTESKTKNLQ